MQLARVSRELADCRERLFDCLTRVLDLECELDETRSELAKCQAERMAALAEAEKLREAAARNSQNSSTPPSTEHPHAAKPARTREPSKRSRGAQPGHPPRLRARVSEEQVREHVSHWPEACRGCEHEFADSERVPAAEPRAWSYVDLDECTGVAFAVEHLYHTLCCPECEALTRAAMGKDACRSPLGPVLQARVVALSWDYRLSYRDVKKHLREFELVKIALGTIRQIHLRAAQAARGVLDEIDEHIEAASVVHADETPILVQDAKRKRQQLWLAATLLAARYRILPSRSTQAALQLLGACRQGLVLITDRLASYNGVISFLYRQVCWAHLKRDFTAISQRPGKDGKLGQALLKLKSELFAHWYQFRQDADREQLKERTAPLREQFRATLEDGRQNALNPTTRRTCANLLRCFSSLFTFIDLPGVEPTNNHAERSLRRWVMWRRQTGGVRTEAAARTAETLMSVISTCILQGHSCYRTFIAIFEAHENGEPAPSILSQPSGRDP
jgi:hypothetical protein